MGSKNWLAVVSLSLTLSTWGIGTTIAYAGPAWTINGVPINAPAETTIKGSSTSTAGITLKLNCNLEGKDTLLPTGGSLTTAVTFTGCNVEAPAKECSVSKVEAEALPWSAGLLLRSKIFYSQIESMKSLVTLEGSSCPVTSTRIVGDLEGEWNGTGLTFPSSPLPGTTLTLEGNIGTVTISGSQTIESTEGTVGVGEEATATTGPWWGVGGSLLAKGVSKAIKNELAQPNSAALNAEAGNKKIKITCEKAPSTGKLWNGSTHGENEEILKVEGKCKLLERTGAETKEVTGCKVKEPITAETHSSLWYHTTNTTPTERTNKIELVSTPTQKGGKVFAKITLEGEGCGALEGVYSLEGTFAGAPLKQNIEIEKAAISFPTEQQKHIWQPTGSENYIESQLELKFNAKEATLVGEATVELSSKEKFGVFGLEVPATSGPWWDVGGSTLAQGVSKAIKNELAQPNSAALNAEVGTKKIKITCEKAPSTGKLWNGSTHGENEETLKIEGNCKVFERIGAETKEVTGCKVKEPITAETHSSLWYHTTNTTPTERTNKIELVSTPTQKGGKVFAKITIFEAPCGTLEGVFNVEGTFAGEPLQQNREVEKATISFPTEQPKHIWQPTSSENYTESQLELKFNAKEATLVGEATVELSSKEKFGVFKP